MAKRLVVWGGITTGSGHPRVFSWVPVSFWSRLPGRGTRVQWGTFGFIRELDDTDVRDCVERHYTFTEATGIDEDFQPVIFGMHTRAQTRVLG